MSTALAALHTVTDTEREVIKRPKVNDTIDWAHGPGPVLEVSGNGRRIRTRDRIGRRWEIEREPHGHWVRIAKAPTSTPTA